ncbi:cytochrome P450 [Aspergillus granulosus]|uniref:Cytochrome P450 n=1 Tax=Aspergillus granulosus TaxID=176169 RepID=A0ABR4HD30_9EURO
MFAKTILQTLIPSSWSIGLLAAGLVVPLIWIVYAKFLHPLSKVPGPFLASVTPFVQLYHGLKGDRHLWIYQLHQRYGPHVRLAPNFVSVNTVEGMHKIYGHGNRFRKADFYNAFPAIAGVYNTHNAIDKFVHGRKRRVLSQAFSDHALKGMEDVMLLHVRQLCSILGRDRPGSQPTNAKDGSTFNMANWFGYLTYDVMGELCFGKSFDMLIDGAKRRMVHLVDRAAYRHYVCGLWMPLHRWHLDQIFIRRLTNDRWKFIMESRQEANQRAKERTAIGQDAKKDFFYYLLNARDPETGKGLATQELWGEANVLMIAGSDTTSTSLAAAIFYLVRNPHALGKLKNEIRSHFSDVEEIVTGAELNKLIYLKACIDEAMRLAPAVPGSIPREASDPVVTVDGLTIPEGTGCGTPPYTIHRTPAYYREPLAYLPERWIEGSICKAADSAWTVSKEEVEIARKAFCPFSIGPRGCIGKSMALMEMRLTLARVLYLFDFELADSAGEDETGHFKMVDHFVVSKSGPKVIVRKRQ